MILPRSKSHLADIFSHVGPFVFVNRILPLLKNASCQKGGDVRIISISSNAYYSLLPKNFKFSFDSPYSLENPVFSYPWTWRYIGRFIFGFDMIRYSVSKAANVLFMQELQQKLDEQGLLILSISVHPGEVATAGVMASNPAIIRFIARLSFLTPNQGAASPLFAATASEIRQDYMKYKGKGLLPIGKVAAPHAVTQDKAQVKGLWENTTKEVNAQLIADCLPPLQPW